MIPRAPVDKKASLLFLCHLGNLFIQDCPMAFLFLLTASSRVREVYFIRTIFQVGDCHANIKVLTENYLIRHSRCQFVAQLSSASRGSHEVSVHPYNIYERVKAIKRIFLFPFM